MDRRHYRTPSLDPYEDREPVVPVARWSRELFQFAVFRLNDLAHRLREFALQAWTLAALFVERPGPTSQHVSQWLSRRLFTIPTFLIVIWLVLIYHGEYSVFETSLSKCDWPAWERWPSNALPHRVAFVADPQLVDPHTYPGRPWPLSTLTVKYTDLYLRRAYSRIQRDLDPDSILFLGDLFDGGREWATESSQSPDERYHQYGQSFWQQEYARFSNIFFRDWKTSKSRIFAPEELLDNTRIIASLPGNHDLGFGANVPLPVRDRFNAFFGPSNRVDIIGNHTFVSLDTVSLSARDQQGSQEDIWRPTEDFLNNARQRIAETQLAHLQHTAGTVPPPMKHPHAVYDASNADQFEEPRKEALTPIPGFPTVLLTHVPLHRQQGTPCGPLREFWPPAPRPPGQAEPVFPDDRNSLHVDGGWGWQYQNVLTRATSAFVLEALGGAVSAVFSGDDHDYCELVHRAYPSPGAGVREITVKSLSWAMGVRRPGFLLASLWNELDAAGARVARADGADERTLQTHLCLLPDQLGVFVAYGVAFGLTLVALAARAVYAALGPQRAPAPPGPPLLPLAGARSSGKASEPAHAASGSGSSSDSSRGGVARSRAAGAGGGGYGLTARTGGGDGWSDSKKDDDWGAGAARAPARVSTATAARTFWREFLSSLWAVVRVVLPVYGLMLLW